MALGQEYKIKRQGPQCPRGSEYYRCRTNLFAGCCSVNPCDMPGCPDDRDQPDPTDDKLDGDRGNVSTTAAKTDHKATPTPTTKDFQSSATPTKSDESSTVETRKEEVTRRITTSRVLASITETHPITFSTQESTSTKISSSHSTISTAAFSNIETRPTATDLAPGTTTPSDGLSSAAKGGIFGAMGAVIITAIVVFFLCGKRGKKLRSSFGGFPSEGRTSYPGKHMARVEETPPLVLPSRPERHDESGFYPARYEEPQSRFTRASAFKSMRNRPEISIHPEQQSMSSLPPITNVLSDTKTASPVYSRQDTSTPELQGSPKQAAVAELVSAGLPKLVNIQNNRHSVQRYRAYHPSLQSPLTNENPAEDLRGDLSATAGDIYRNRYVNSWSRWDPGVAR